MFLFFLIFVYKIGGFYVRHLHRTCIYISGTLINLFLLSGKLSAVVEQIIVKLDINVADGQINVKSFDVLELEGFEIVNVTGMTKVFNWLVKFVINRFYHAVKCDLIEALEVKARKSLQKKINRLLPPKPAQKTM